MSNETESKTSLQPVLSTHDLNDDLAGANVLALLQRAADVAEGNSRYALDVAKDLSRRLIASQARVAELERRLAELEVEVQVHRDRSEQRNSGSTRFRPSYKDGSRENHSTLNANFSRNGVGS